MFYGHSEFIDVEYWKDIPPKKLTYEQAKSGEVVQFGVGGLQIDFDKIQTAQSIGLGMQLFSGVKVSFFKGDEHVGEMKNMSILYKQDPKRVRPFKLPKQARKGFDRILIKGKPHSEQSYTFGHLELDVEIPPPPQVVLKEFNAKSESDKIEMGKFLKQIGRHSVQCYEIALEQFPELKGDVLFTVKDDGEKLNFEYEKKLPELKILQRCFTNRFNKVRRPRLDSPADVHFELIPPKKK